MSIPNSCLLYRFRIFCQLGSSVDMELYFFFLSSRQSPLSNIIGCIHVRYACFSFAVLSTRSLALLHIWALNMVPFRCTFLHNGSNLHNTFPIIRYLSNLAHIWTVWWIYRTWIHFIQCKIYIYKGQPVITIIIFINCSWPVSRWQWLLCMYINMK